MRNCAWCSVRSLSSPTLHQPAPHASNALHWPLTPQPAVPPCCPGPIPISNEPCEDTAKTRHVRQGRRNVELVAWRSQTAQFVRAFARSSALTRARAVSAAPAAHPQRARSHPQITHTHSTPTPTHPHDFSTCGCVWVWVHPHVGVGGTRTRRSPCTRAETSRTLKP